MKKFALFFLALFLLVLSSCSEGDKYLPELIPQDVTYLVKIEGGQLMRKMEYKDEKDQPVKNSFYLLQKIIVQDKQMLAELDTIFRSIDSYGIDLGKSFFAFESPTIHGLAFKVADSDRLKDRLISAGFVTDNKIQRKNGIGSFMYNKSIYFAWNKYQLLIVKYISDEEIDLNATVRSFFRQKKERSITSNNAVRNLLSNGSDVAIYNTDVLINKLLKSNSKDEINFESVLVGCTPLTYISFEKGEVKIEIDLIFGDEEKRTYTKKSFESIFKNSTGAHLAYFDKMPNAFQTTNINGDSLKMQLNRDGLSKQIGAIPFININDIVSNLNGDITLVQTIDSTGNEIKYTFMIDLKDRNAMDNTLNQYSNPPTRFLKKTGANHFELPNSDYYLGIKDNMLYMTTDNSFEHNHLDKAYKLKDSLLVTQMKDNRVLFYGDSLSVSSMAQSYVNAMAPANKMTGMLDLIKSYSVVMDDNFRVSIDIQFSDKKKNSLASVCEFMNRRNLYSALSNE
ncbi:DUF4836 family protein [Dysgonomonas sp. 520]|uniref:DUF4836 family protein n=1 Tax=Dysgonomonas sp. 520 TaxID=2302931 RepID=UPI0013D39B26|nr:DUF4836 family protein [Dysgonomonas sp. 520]NDW08777.1 DUF4836 family protein [Dysgonomonas sp. 520]